MEIGAVLHCSVHNQHEKDVTLKERCSVGRDEEQNDLWINHSVLSRRHGEFFFQNGEWWYQDLSSSNGTFVNGRAITEPVRLVQGDKLSFCMKGTLLPLVELVFEDVALNVQPDTAKKQPTYTGREHKEFNQQGGCSNKLIIDIEKREVMAAHQKKVLLKDIHLQIEQGEMTLILGGSGAGKTTFVNAVMGYEKADGTIRYGNMDVYADYEKMKYEIGFVPQKDLLRDADTVYDTLYNAVQMKMPEQINEPEHRRRVEEIMLLLGLDKQRDTLVKKLSGGQRKRLSIAMEFAGDPQLFFLDEPDSGLDGIMARALMEKLREIADMGKIIMVITHAPDRVAELFDKVIVLSKSNKDDVGHLVYYGSITDAFKFFETQSLEEIVKRINNVNEGGEGRADEFIMKWESQNE